MRTALLSVLLLLLAMTAPVVAQEAPTGTEVQTVMDESNATETETAASEPVTYRGSVDETLRIRSVSYSDGVMTVTVEADVPKLVVLSAWSSAAAGGEGVHDVPQSRTSVSPGVTRLSVDAQPSRGMVQISVATNRGAVLISQRTSSSWFQGTPDWSTVQGVAGVSALIGALTPAVIAYRRKRSEQGQIRRVR